MKPISVILIVVFFALQAEPSQAQGLSCLGGSITTYDKCPSCTSGRQTRAESQCTQSADIHGNPCGSRACEPCTCEGGEAASGDAGWIRAFERPTPQPQPQPAQTPQVIPSRASQRPAPNAQAGGPLISSGGPRVRTSDFQSAQLTMEQAFQCLVIERYLASPDPSRNFISVWIRNRCNMCMDADIGMQNLKNGEFAVSPNPARLKRQQKFFRLNAVNVVHFNVNSRSDWLTGEGIALSPAAVRTAECR